MRRLIVFFLLTCLARAATFTAVASGDWQATATWGTSGSGCHVAYPCMTDSGNAGDQVVIGNFAVTCGLTVTEICSAGTSPNDILTTLAISLPTSGGSLTLANGSTLVYAGAVGASNNTTLTACAGCKIQYDSSWATTPTIGYIFRWGPNTGTTGVGILNLNGTSANHVTWQGDSSLSPTAKPGVCALNACLAGAIGMNTTPTCAPQHGFGTETYVDYRNIGGTPMGSTNVSVCFYVGSSTLFGSINLSHVTFDNCSTVRAMVNSTSDVNSLIMSSISLTNCASTSLGDNCFRYGNASGVNSSTGTYTITGLLADGGVNQSSSTTDGKLDSRNFFLWAGQGGATPHGPYGFPNANGVSGGVYDQIVVDNTSWVTGTGTGTYNTFLPSNLTNSVMWASRTMRVAVHLQFVKNQQNSVGTAGAYAAVNNVFGGIGAQDPPDTGSVYTQTTGQSPSVPTTFLFKGNLQLCGFLPQAGGSLMMVGGYVNGTATNQSNTITGNTFCNVYNVGENQPTNGAAGFESATIGANTIASIDSNTFFNSAPGGARLVAVQGTSGGTVSQGAIGYVGYNGALNGTSYINVWSGYASLGYVAAEGPYTLIQKMPGFPDPQRTVIFFDTDYLDPEGLLKVSSYNASPWVSGQTYNVGDVISYTDQTVYNGKTTYWRCVQAHTSGTTNQPFWGWDSSAPRMGMGAYWEPAMWQWVRNQVYENVTYNRHCAALLYVQCPTPTYITGLLNAWVRAGYVSMDVPLWNACSPDRGVTMQECGALPQPPIRHMAAVLAVN